MTMKKCILLLPLVAFVSAAHADNKGVGRRGGYAKPEGAGRTVMMAAPPAHSAVMDAQSKNAKMLTQTLSEEKTEINALTAQQAAFKRMGGTDNLKIAAMWGRWIAEHKAGGPMFMKLIKANGGDPMQAKILKAPVLGSKDVMLMATHKDHQAAVTSSKMRASMTNSADVKKAMMKRVALASKHLKQMAPYHHAMKM